jgi:hypothetical protein
MSLRDLILSNFRRKLFALLVAILIWSIIHFADKPARKGQPSGRAPGTNSLVTP